MERMTINRVVQAMAGVAALLLLQACEKEIDIDYRTVGSMYVAEGSVTQNGTSVLLSTTMNVDDNARRDHVVEGATVVVSVPDLGLAETLTYRGNGRYESSLRGIVGNVYQLDIDVDGQHFTATSTMQEVPVVNSFRFVWRKVVTETMLFADLRIQDRPNENNYYFMHIYRNNIGYRWAVMRDDAKPGGELQQLFNCALKRDIEKEGNNEVSDGDRIRVEVRSIDRASYDYLYSMQLMDNTGTNPILNFTGGCLGYFSAYGVTTSDMTFHLAEVEEDE